MKPGEGDSAAPIKIDNLTEFNFHIWKQKKDLVFTNRDVDEHWSQFPPYSPEPEEPKTWVHLNKQDPGFHRLFAIG